MNLRWFPAKVLLYRLCERSVCSLLEHPGTRELFFVSFLSWNRKQAKDYKKNQ